jgi:3-deoxy-manno-octulosonate cytidylyltransferase (CMP-KDO synthetase)
MPRALIVIAARYGSKRMPGKPLIPIAGVPLVERVWHTAENATRLVPNTKAVVATDDSRSMDFLQSRAIPCIMTPEKCRSGTDRVQAAIEALGESAPDISVNLQGDNPLCPPEIISGLIEECYTHPEAGVITPAAHLTWEALDTLREQKKTTPHSGTFAVFVPEKTPENKTEHIGGHALYFSKSEIPAMRDEKAERERSPQWSPLYRHIGLYAYRMEALRRFSESETGRFEALEQLEQLRFLELGIPIRIMEAELGALASATGVDSPEDIKRAEAFFI